MPWRKVVAWVAAFLLLPLLLLEVAVRVLHLAPGIPEAIYSSDPVLPFRTQPSATFRGRSASDEFDYVYQDNRDGFRDVEHERAKPPGVFRILAVGDSFTYGVGVPYEETWLVRLERLLNARPGEHPRVEIVKAGIPRYFPEPERLLVEHYGFAYDPDLILVAFVPNDVIDTSLGLDAMQASPEGFLFTREGARSIERLGGWAPVLYRHSHLFRLVFSRILAARAARAHPTRWDDVYRAGGLHERDWQEVERQYRALDDDARARNVRVVLVHLPQEPARPDAAYPGERLAAFARTDHVGFVDTLPAIRAALPGASLYWPRDGHPNAEGDRVIADSLLAGLTAQGAVP